MAARAIWKGVIRFGDVRLPVKLYSGVEDRRIHFRLLHDADHVPVRRVMVNPATGEAVPYEDTRRGYEVEDGIFVVLDDEELEAIDPGDSRDIEVTRFLPSGTIHPQWYDRPYWLGPDGDVSAYFAVGEALREEGREGVAHWVMRKREYRGALRAEGDHLALVTLRHRGEVVPAAALEPPSGRDLEESEVEMAGRLIASLEGDFEPERYRDEYRERVMELIEAKAEGKTIEIGPHRRERAREGSLADLLRESLEEVEQRKGKKTA